MNTKRVNTVAGVILAAQKTRQTAAGIAMVLEAACLLQSPDLAAEQLAMVRELDALRLRVAVLEAERAAVLAQHTPRLDSPHCVADGERWPCPTRVVLPAPAGALAEDRHQVDPLDHVMERLAEGRPADAGRTESVAKLRALLARQSGQAREGACSACGDVPAEWCPDCAACRQGCHGGHDGNPCTHPNAPWTTAPVQSGGAS